MADVLRAMISSTTRDLPEHRRQAEDACLRQEFLPKMMEHLPPSPADAVRLSLDLVDSADVYVLILGLRYGEVPTGYDKSYTHLEYERAVARGIPILAMLSSDDHPFRGGDIERGIGAEKLDQLRDKVRRGGCALFSSAQDLRAQLVHGLGEIKPRLQPARAMSPHYIHRPDAPPTPYIAHPYTLLDARGLQGREAELSALSAWVSDPGSARVMVLVAIGGMGKSALTWRWFHDMASRAMPVMAGRVWWSFYETDATFANFVLRTLAYVTGRAVEELLAMPAPEREDALLSALNREPHLVVLDGLERLLIAYARPDAARLADDELDAQTANVVADERGLPASAAVSFTGQSRLRVAADPRVGSFLRKLATVRKARILVTSRLYPAELQDPVTAEPVPGAHPYFLRGLAQADALRLWRGLGGTGMDDELTNLFAGFDYYPLLIRALAGEVRRFRPAPGDLAAWRLAHPGFDPFALPLKQRNSHVLAFALDGLTATNEGVLDVIAAFRAPVRYDTLVALLVGDDCPCADEPALDRELTELEERGLLGWDRRANRYDLHPVVRGVTWARLDAQTRHGIDENLAAHFESIPAVATVTSIDQLAIPIELFHTLVRLGRLGPARDLAVDSFIDALGSLGAWRELAQLASSLVDAPEEAIGSNADENDDRAAIAAGAVLAAFAYAIAADFESARRFLDRGQSAARAVVDESTVMKQRVFDLIRVLESLVLCAAGRLVEAQEAVCQAILKDVYSEVSAMAGRAAVALIKAQQGVHVQSAAWLSDYRIGPDTLFNWMTYDELAKFALEAGDDAALAHVLDALVEFDEEMGGVGRSVAELIRAVCAGSSDGDGRAVERFQDILVAARTSGRADIEVRAGTELGRLHRAAGRSDMAGEAVTAALETAERCGLRLRGADLLVLRARLALDSGDRGAAVADAVAAYRAAWCDGPPYCYDTGLVDARRLLADLGASEPVLPVSRPTSVLSEVLRPMPSLRPEHAVLRRLAWPAPADASADPVEALVSAGLFGAPDAVIAALAEAIVGPAGPEVLLRLQVASLADRDRLELRLWLRHGGFSSNAPPLASLLRAADVIVRREAMAEAVGALDPVWRRLLSVELDDERPYLDPNARVPDEHVQRAARTFGWDETEVRANLARLARQLGVSLGEPDVSGT